MNVKVESLAKEAMELKNEAITRALEKIGLMAEAYAKVEITNQGAVDTGNLRNSITHEARENYVVVGTNVEYAPYVELGTHKMKERPYLKPAIDNHLPQYKEIIKQALKE